MIWSFQGLAGPPPLSAARRATFDAAAVRFAAFVAQVDRGDGVDIEDVQRWGRKERLPFLGGGEERAVFRVAEGALKIAFGGPRRWLANRNEDQVWREAPAHIRQHLVPVLAMADDGHWLLMERATPWPRTQMGYSAKMNPIAKLLGECGIGDVDERNVAADGRVFDYAWVQQSKWQACPGRLA